MPNGIAVTKMMPSHLKPEKTCPTAGKGIEKPKCDTASPTAPRLNPP